MEEDCSNDSLNLQIFLSQLRGRQGGEKFEFEAKSAGGNEIDRKVSKFVDKIVILKGLFVLGSSTENLLC